MDSPARSDRVFVLMWHSVDLARLISVGSIEMFWETFLVMPLGGGPRLAKVLDERAWSGCEFVLRHERTGDVLRDVFSAGGRPPRSLDDGVLTVELRGTWGYAPSPPRRPPRRVWLRLARWFVGRS